MYKKNDADFYKKPDRIIFWAKYYYNPVHNNFFSLFMG